MVINGHNQVLVTLPPWKKHADIFPIIFKIKAQLPNIIMLLHLLQSIGTTC
jgi:hypothetical protein